MRGKKFFAVVTAFSTLAAMAPQSFVVNAAETEYQIYPNPQSIEYEAGSFALDEKVNVVIESGIDEVTTDKVSDILDKNSLTGSTSSKVITEFLSLMQTVCL